MAVTINASTSAGLISTADTSGILQLQTASTTAVTVDASQNVGVGMTPVYKLDVTGGNGNAIRFTDSVNSVQVAMGAFNSNGFFGTLSNHSQLFYVNSGEGMRLTSTGLGIGTSSPTQKLDVYGNGMKVNNASYVGYLGAGNTFASGAASDFCVRSDNVLSFASNGPYERARFLSSGQLLVGTTSNLGGSSIQSFNGIDARATDNYNSIPNIQFFTAVDTTGGVYCDFKNSATARIGSITRAGTSSVAYNTTSDYRLKTVTGAVTGQGARIDALKPIDYLWKEGNSQARGFLAHEFQTVYPNSVTGDKDALDADGKPKYQVMQASTSEVIADLVAEIQSLRVRVAQLETN
jgi:hypothetical protein